jgi:cysteine-rich repeat protein
MRGFLAGVLAALALGCAASEFVVVEVENGGRQAPEFDTVEVSVLGEVEGQTVEKSFSLDNPDQRSLPISFFLEFDSQHAGLEIELRVLGEKNGVGVFEASGSAIVGQEAKIAAVFCGDGILQSARGEICDDGNRNNGDGCRDDCTEEQCGDGRLDPQEECDDDNNAEGDGCRDDCTEEQCGDGIFDIGEFCDDGNVLDNDGCDNDCSAPDILQLVAGDDHTCVLVEGGFVKCWGEGASGRLGYGNQNTIGDNELPSSVGFVDVGGKVTQLAAGRGHTCALLDTGKVRCWGFNAFGQLGYGNTNNIGDNELPSSSGDVDLGSGVVVAQIAAGGDHNCAILTNGSLKCWGGNSSGQLGYGNTTRIGDNETPSAVGTVSVNNSVGVTVLQVVMGSVHTCALLSTRNVRCWGANFNGRLGYGNTITIGDNEVPSSIANPDVLVGGAVAELSASNSTTCARLDSGGVRCWGSGALVNGVSGNLGYATLQVVGDNETPNTSGDINLGASAIRIATGSDAMCALLSPNQTNQFEHIRCWGTNAALGLGLNPNPPIGDNETPIAANLAPVDIGGAAVAISSGFRHICAVRDNGQLFCWGDSEFGQIGHGSFADVGDKETPLAGGAVELFTPRGF